ncbi:MAG: hypothetical protein H6742_08335 [Alphaproteobacteria bacterium]|nr:hypothetical protein [Alphaproteobacteria bacterium]
MSFPRILLPPKSDAFLMDLLAFPMRDTADRDARLLQLTASTLPTPTAPTQEWALRVRDWLFGPTVELTLACPECNEEADLSFESDDVWPVVAELGDDELLELGLTCPDCAAEHQPPVDFATVLWDELRAWEADRFREVHLLATAYGWTQADVLGLSQRQRDAYLALLG